MTRPDFQGGDSRLGYWNLYGRLLNEGPWGALELGLDVLRPTPGTNEVWAHLHTKVEGNSFWGADPLNGALRAFGVTQMYVRAGNILLDKVTWQLGTLDTYYGDLGLYDFRPAQLFLETLGLSALYQTERFDLLVGVGDSGYIVRGGAYNTLFTGGMSLRLRLSRHFELGAGGQAMYEPQVEGNRFAPYSTPGVRYEDYLRRDVARTYFAENPTRSRELFIIPEPRSSLSWKLIGYLGFGGFGPLVWSNLFVHFQKRHPDNFYFETFEGREYQVFTQTLTDERYELLGGNEMQLRLIPDRLDAAWGVLFGHTMNADNTIAPGDDNRTFFSTVLRLQLYLTQTAHLLLENSLAREISNNGNVYRNHVDSVFRNSGGIPDSRGFEYGDSNVRNTWQLKTGIVLNPTGMGIYTRPSLRLLYGLQYSSQQAAFGSGFVDDLNQYNIFQGPERHWHSVVAIEAEAWF